MSNYEKALMRLQEAEIKALGLDQKFQNLTDTMLTLFDMVSKKTPVMEKQAEVIKKTEVATSKYDDTLVELIELTKQTNRLSAKQIKMFNNLEVSMKGSNKAGEESVDVQSLMTSVTAEYAKELEKMTKVLQLTQKQENGMVTFYNSAGEKVNAYGQKLTKTNELMGDFNKRTAILSNSIAYFTREGRAMPFLEGMSVYLEKGGTRLEYLAEFLTTAREELTIFGFEAAKARKFLYGFAPRGTFRMLNKLSSNFQLLGGMIRKSRDNGQTLREELSRLKEAIKEVPEGSKAFNDLTEMIKQIEAVTSGNPITRFITFMSDGGLEKSLNNVGLAIASPLTAALDTLPKLLKLRKAYRNVGDSAKYQERIEKINERKLKLLTKIKEAQKDVDEEGSPEQIQRLDTLMGKLAKLERLRKGATVGYSGMKRLKQRVKADKESLKFQTELLKSYEKSLKKESKLEEKLRKQRIKALFEIKLIKKEMSLVQNPQGANSEYYASLEEIVDTRKKQVKELNKKIGIGRANKAGGIVAQKQKTERNVESARARIGLAEGRLAESLEDLGIGKQFRNKALEGLLDRHPTLRLIKDVFKVTKKFIIPALGTVLAGLIKFMLAAGLIFVGIFLILKALWPSIKKGFQTAKDTYNEFKGIFVTIFDKLFRPAFDRFKEFFRDGNINALAEGLMLLLGGIVATAIAALSLLVLIAYRNGREFLSDLYKRAEDYLKKKITGTESFFGRFGKAIANLIGIVAVIVGAIVFIASGAWIGLLLAGLGVALLALIRPVFEALRESFPKIFLKKEDRQAMAKGGIARGGMTLVGEEGAELVNLPKGARVHSHMETKRMLKGTGGSSTVNNFNITVNAKDSSKAELRRMADEIGRMVSSKINRSTSSNTFR